MSSVALMLLLQNKIFCGSAPSSNSMTVIRLFNAQPDNAHLGLRASSAVLPFTTALRQAPSPLLIITAPLPDIKPKI